MSVPSVIDQVNRQVARQWWVPVLRGVLLIILGIMVLIWPKASVVAFYWVAAIFLVADGLVALVGGIASKGAPNRGWTITFGILAIILGIAAFVWPGITLVVIFALAAAWAIVGGIVAIVGAWQARSIPGSGWGWGLTMGILLVLLGIMLIIWPVTGAVSLTITALAFIGVFAIVGGVLSIISGYKLHSLGKRLPS